jgi:hypothetical protein
MQFSVLGSQFLAASFQQLAVSGWKLAISQFVFNFQFSIMAAIVAGFLVVCFAFFPGPLLSWPGLIPFFVLGRIRMYGVMGWWSIQYFWCS